uniref:Uncharacterized protein n=1 Tax=Arundo donax TaxID=35708 RepID=A0A0A9FR38_ARUDO
MWKTCDYNCNHWIKYVWLTVYTKGHQHFSEKKNSIISNKRLAKQQKTLL